jgi:phenylalanyl-tRNA synthetase beta chain
MKLSLAWLNEWADVGADPRALAARLTMAGFEVEAIEPAAQALSGVVVAEVESVTRHPQADRLSVCRVRHGEAASVQVVCGAPNVRAGLTAPLARVGARLPGGAEIRRAELRGVESLGMLCSARELGLGEDQDGLLELPAGLVPGTPLAAALGLADTVFEINLTPNRGDALSVLGLARELAVLNGAPLRVPDMPSVAATLSERLPVELAAPAGCAKFAHRVLRGLDPAARTPLWMRERLRRAGMRSLGPLVDVTNYVMLELGQPMHAYDLRRLDSKVVVRWASAGETLTLLDGRCIALEPDMLVIADARRPVGLAGIMGGEHSGIAPDTCDVFLEVAWFAPAAVAGRGRRLGLLTDASQRFERGVDPTGQERALERATALLLEIGGGAAGPLVVERSSAHLPLAQPIELERAHLKRLIGIEVPDARVGGILAALGFEVAATASGWRARAPAWRFDVLEEADLIEEVARVYGYNEIPEIDASIPQRPGAVPEGRIGAGRLALLLVDRGYFEVINYSFVDPALQRRLFPGVAALPLANPISAELAEMRLSLWPGLLKSLSDNVRRQVIRARLFEVGVKFHLQGNELKEISSIAGVAWGAALPEQWGAARTPGDFYDLKADVEALLAATGEPGAFRFVAEGLPCLHPGRSARIYRGDRACGWVGELHPELARTLELVPPPLLFDLELDITSTAGIPAGHEVSRLPSVRRDLAVVVDETLTFSQLRESVTVAASSLLQEIKVFDVYRGGGIESGRKSVGLGLIFQDKSTTLTDADVDAVMTAVRERLKTDWNASIRD